MDPKLPGVDRLSATDPGGSGLVNLTNRAVCCTERVGFETLGGEVSRFFFLKVAEIRKNRCWKKKCNSEPLSHHEKHRIQIPRSKHTSMRPRRTISHVFG